MQQRLEGQSLSGGGGAADIGIIPQKMRFRFQNTIVQHLFFANDNEPIMTHTMGTGPLQFYEGFMTSWIPKWGICWFPNPSSLFLELILKCIRHSYNVQDKDLIKRLGVGGDLKVIFDP